MFAAPSRLCLQLCAILVEELLALDGDWVNGLHASEQRNRSNETPHDDSCLLEMSKMIDGVGKSLVLRRRDARSSRVREMFRRHEAGERA